MFAILPIAAGHLAVPPLSVFEGREYPLVEFLGLLYDLWPRGVLTHKNVLSWMVKDSDPSSTVVSSRLITHIFVHADYSHLLNNLQSALQCGGAVYSELGCADMYFVFFGGGAAAALPTLLKHDQTRQYAEQMVAVPSAAYSYLPGWLARPVRSGSNALVGIMHDVIVKTSVSCGSSGAVSALMGCSLAHTLAEAVAAAADKWSELATHDGEMAQRLVADANNRGAARSIGVGGGSLEAVERLQAWQRDWLFRLERRIWACLQSVVLQPGFAWRALNALNVVRLLLADASYLGLLGAANAELASAGGGGMKINRAGHLQGAMFGAAWALLRSASKRRAARTRLV